MIPAQATLRPDGRMHLHHGPIDLIIGCEGPGRARALDLAAALFRGLLEGLVAELPALRRPARPGTEPVHPVARAMQAAVLPHAAGFVTPMAAVAGAVADHVLAAMVAGAPLHRAYVNNGGDIALHLGPGQRFGAAIAGLPGARVVIDAAEPARGIATSGWRGRSQSLGIADAVTVVASSAAAADVAATLIANAVDLPGHAAVTRVPARDIAPDSDLGPRRVTVAVGALTASEIARALDSGQRVAAEMGARGLILGACLTLGGQTRLTGSLVSQPEACIA